MAGDTTDPDDPTKVVVGDAGYWETVDFMAMNLRYSAAQTLARRLLEEDIDIAKWIILNVKDK